MSPRGRIWNYLFYLAGRSGDGLWGWARTLKVSMKPVCGSLDTLGIKFSRSSQNWSFIKAFCYFSRMDGYYIPIAISCILSSDRKRICFSQSRSSTFLLERERERFPCHGVYSHSVCDLGMPRSKAGERLACPRKCCLICSGCKRNEMVS